MWSFSVVDYLTATKYREKRETALIAPLAFGGARWAVLALVEAASLLAIGPLLHLEPRERAAGRVG